MFRLIVGRRNKYAGVTAKIKIKKYKNKKYKKNWP